jgi:hypothetical protein
MTTMATAKKEIPNAEELRAQIESMLEPQWVGVGAIALAIPVPVDMLVDWLAGHPIEAKLPRFEKEIASYLESRAAWLAEVKNADADRRRELKFARAREVRELSEKLREESSPTPYANMLHAGILFGLYDLLSLFDDQNCWRCGSSLRDMPAAIVETQIELHLRAAGWAAWPEDVFRERMRAAMVDGDRILAVNIGRVWVRRSDGSVYRVLRGHPINGGGVEEGQ